MGRWVEREGNREGGWGSCDGGRVGGREVCIITFKSWSDMMSGQLTFGLDMI